MKKKRKSKNTTKLYLFSVLAVWIVLSFFEIVTMLFTWPKPIYWRAWEVVSNYEGQDRVYAPFKPMSYYDGIGVGDLLNGATLKPLASEIKRQVFRVDEYGFRNPIGMLDKPIDAIIIGSSFVAGAAETQENLVSSLLTNKYKLPTYNGALYIVQDYVEDTRFIKNPPKYLIILGSEGEMISAPYRYAVTDRGITNYPKKWNSFEEWKKQINPFTFTYEKTSQYLQNLSMIRYLVNELYFDLVNFGRNREEVVRTSKVQIVTYDSPTGMLFFQLDYDIPLLGSQGKTKDDITKAITVLEQTSQLLKERGTTLIVVAMPSKANLEYSGYKNLPREKRAIVAFEKQLDRSQVEHINMFDITYTYMQKQGNHLYYADDGHWNAKTNEIIAELLAKKIKQLEERNNEQY